MLGGALAAASKFAPSSDLQQLEYAQSYYTWLNECKKAIKGASNLIAFSFLVVNLGCPLDTITFRNKSGVMLYSSFT